MDPLALALLFGGFTLLIWGSGLLAFPARTRENLTCPADGSNRSIVFKRELNLGWAPGRAVDVIACSAFADPCDVRCLKACLSRQG
jgi:hypothetical protein